MIYKTKKRKLKKKSKKLEMDREIDINNKQYGVTLDKEGIGTLYKNVSSRMNPEWKPVQVGSNEYEHYISLFEYDE